MKTVLLADNLQKGISVASHAVSQRSQLPILLNFLLKAEGGFLTVSATDLEIGIITKIPAKIDEEGETTIPAKTFMDLVSSISQEKINLETKDSTLILTTTGTVSTFPTSDPQEFPKILSEPGAKNQAAEWFKSQGFSQEGVCRLPVFFYLSPNVRRSMETQDITFSPLPPGC